MKPNTVVLGMVLILVAVTLSLSKQIPRTNFKIHYFYLLVYFGIIP